MASSSSQMIDKLLSVAYSEVQSGDKTGEKELEFIGAVFDFLNRQSSYLSDKKVADQLIKLTKKSIDNSNQKNDAVNKPKNKKKDKKNNKKNKKDKKDKKKKPKSKDPDKNVKIYTSANKSKDIEKEKENAVKIKQKIASAKDKNVKKDKYKATTKQKKNKSKNKKAKQDKSGNYQNDAPNDIPITSSHSNDGNMIDILSKVNEMYAQFKYNYKKDFKTLAKILGKLPSKRVASSYLIELCKIIRLYAPNLLLDADATRPIRGCDRAFRLSSNYEGRIYISDFEYAYELTEDQKNDKVLNADMISNHAVCRHDAASVYVDHSNNVFFHELSSFKNEALMILVPGKPAPKRVLQYKPIGDRCVCVDSYCFVKEKELPKGCSIVLIKNGSKHISLNKIPTKAGGKKLSRKQWTKFNKKVPNAEFLCLNKRHDALFILTTDLENYIIRLSCVCLSKSVKKESKIIIVKQWEDFDFEELGYPGSGFWPKAISMCYMRDSNKVIVAIQKHLFMISENPNEKYDYYNYYLGYAGCLCYDIAQNPKKKNSIVAVDGVIKHCKLYSIDIL